MTNQELLQHGYELCEFGDDCNFCEEVAPQGELFFKRTSHEYIEGDYYCRACATQKINERAEFYAGFAEWTQEQQGKQQEGQ